MPPRKRTRRYYGRPYGHVTDDIVRTLRQLKRAEGQARTSLYHDLAEHIVALREHFLIEETGEPDWIGRTSVYRHTVRDLYSKAGYTPEEAKSVQSSIRYHVGNVVRQILRPEDVEDLGLDAVSPLERARETRQAQAALLERARELMRRHPELMQDYPPQE